MIKNKSSLLPLNRNVNNPKLISVAFSNSSSLRTDINNKLISYKNIFNKNILWIKLYDNYLYNFLYINKNNKLSIFEPKSHINPHSTSINTSIKKIDDNKILINKNTIKLFNLNNKDNSNSLLTSSMVEVKKDMKIYKYINTISEFKNETVKYQNIVYQFNKNNKEIQNSSVIINKNVFTLLESTFLSMSSLISKPFIVFTPHKIVIQLFYYLNINALAVNHNKFININNNKLQSLCLNLSKIYKKPVELELDRLHYPYYDSNILSNMIGLISNIVKLRFIFNKLFSIAKINNNKSLNKSSIIPSYLSGFKIKIAGRLLTQRVIPRLTIKNIQIGTLARSKTKFIDTSRFINKNKRGSFSISVSIGHQFF